MVIVVECECGRKLRADARLAGRWVKCPACNRAVQVPALDAPPAPQAPLQTPPAPREDLSISDAPVREGPAPFAPPRFTKPDMSAYSAPRPVIAPPSDDTLAAENSWRGYIFWLLLLAMIPLAVETFAGHEKAIDRINRTLQAHPEIIGHVDAPDRLTRRDEERILQMLPEHRLDGAFVSNDSLIQWPLAWAAAGVFLAMVTFAIPGLPARPLTLTLAGLFTGTAGVLMLYAIQIVGFLCVCCIGLAYIAALDPHAPIGASLLGFFFGVGFFEETIKSLPVLWLLYKHQNVPWRRACLVGMASGAGFGISEGIHYASNFYNGVEPASVYARAVPLLRCVSHAAQRNLRYPASTQTAPPRRRQWPRRLAVDLHGDHQLADAAAWLV